MTDPTASSALRDRIRNAVDIESELVDVPQWGVKVEVRTMNGRQRAHFLSAMNSDSVDFERLYPDLLITCAYDPETNDLIFVEEDRDWLLDKSGNALEVVALAAMRVSGLSEKTETEVGKSSSDSATEPEATPSDDSTSN